MRNLLLRLAGTHLALLILFALGLSAGRPAGVSAQSADIIWSPLVNLSNSPTMTSADPFLLADPAGVAHLFWAEKVSVLPGNTPDTIMYSQWDGQTWSQPLDIYFAPTSDGNTVVNFPHAVLDRQGIVHLIWLSQPNFPYYSLFYGSAPAAQAKYVQTWTPRKAIAEDLSGTEYSIHIALDDKDNLHVVYASGVADENTKEERGVKYLRSTDGGVSWSEPVSIFTVPNLSWGASNVRIITAPGGRLFASWTVWGEGGNGLAVYFARSLDNGLTWDTPIMLAQAREGEYERDWNSLLLLPDGQLVAMWEGGFRAYRYGMYSGDDGATWTEPVDLFPKLIGENGFAEFASDSSETLHLFYSQRIREGSGSTGQGQVIEGLWHSVWKGGKNWSNPMLIGGVNPMVNPKAAIIRGNRVVVVWYSNNVGEIITMTGEIPSAPVIPPQPWAETSPILRSTREPAASQPAAAEAVIPNAEPAPGSPAATSFANTPPPGNLDPAWAVYLGAVPSLAVLAIFLGIRMWKHRE